MTDDQSAAPAPLREPEIQRLRDHWATGRYGDQGLRLKAEETVGVLDRLLAEIDKLRSDLAQTQAEKAQLEVRFSYLQQTIKTQTRRADEAEAKAALTRLSSERPRTKETT